ncbi:MAG TPA: luciferase family protein [Bauldia sp.]|nr:luciferase family protein [Bauldia sp.]
MTPSEAIRTAMLQMPGVTAAPHRFGAVEFRVGEREIGHLHGDRLLDVPFPRRVKDELVSSGAAEPHHVLPESGWISFRLKTAADTEHAIALLRRSYDLIRAQLERRQAQSDKVRGRPDG